jgi:hypothetical protein
MMANTWTVVTNIPNCDICKDAKAYADGKMTIGPWANMCKECFAVLGIGLGMGKGQELLTEPRGGNNE